MVNVFGAERVMDELPFIFDDGQGFLWHQPQVAPLAADAALAVAHGFDLGRLDLEDKGTAVAVAAVRLGRLLGVGHVVARDDRLIDLSVQSRGIKSQRGGDDQLWTASGVELTFRLISGKGSKYTKTYSSTVDIHLRPRCRSMREHPRYGRRQN